MRLNARESVERALASAGISVSSLRFVKIYSKGKKGKEAEPAYMNYFDGQNGGIIAAANFRDWDTTAADKKLWLLEVMWYSRDQVARHHRANVSGLR